MLKKYEVGFGSANTHPHFVKANTVAEAMDLAVKAKNKHTRDKVSLDAIYSCAPTDKIRVEEICEPYIFSPGGGCNVPIERIEANLEQILKYGELILEPDFQRAHVWTESQQIAFVEHLLRGGKSGREIIFNRKDGWNNAINKSWPTVLVDGLQRLTAVRKFVRGDLVVFGKYTANSFEYLNSYDLIFVENRLDREEDVLKWYLQINSGGTQHTEAELEKVRNMLKIKKEK